MPRIITQWFPLPTGEGDGLGAGVGIGELPVGEGVGDEIVAEGCGDRDPLGVGEVTGPGACDAGWGAPAALGFVRPVRPRRAGGSGPLESSWPGTWSLPAMTGRWCAGGATWGGSVAMSTDAETAAMVTEAAVARV